MWLPDHFYKSHDYSGAYTNVSNNAQGSGKLASTAWAYSVQDLFTQVLDAFLRL